MGDCDSGGGGGDSSSGGCNNTTDTSSSDSTWNNSASDNWDASTSHWDTNHLHGFYGDSIYYNQWENSALLWHIHQSNNDSSASAKQPKKYISRESQAKKKRMVNTIIISFPEISKNVPTVFPERNFIPAADAEALRKAIKGFFTDEAAFIDIICRRSNEQRQTIRDTYWKKFEKSLIEDIRSKTRGNVTELLIALLTPTTNFYAVELHDAMADPQNYELVMIEVLCTESNSQIVAIKKAYERIYGKSLKSELKAETSLHFKTLLTLLLAAKRDESNIVDEENAEFDARQLVIATEGMFPPSVTISEIFSQRSFAQIKLIFEKFQNITGQSLETTIRNEYSGDFARALISIMQISMNKAAFFAKRLHYSIRFNLKQTIRIIATRSEVDMYDIKMAYKRLYGVELRSLIKETSRNYKHALYTLVGEKRSQR